jgi:zinc transporter 2
LICVFFITVEVVGGYIANSIAIMTDAAHLLSDLLGFQISIVALFLGQRPASMSLTYGYHRAEVVGALCSVILIWGLTIWLLYEAIKRMIVPQKVAGGLMLFTSIIGLFCNLVMAKVLHERASGASFGHSHGAGGCGGHGGGDRGHEDHGDNHEGHSHGGSGGHEAHGGHEEHGGHGDHGHGDHHKNDEGNLECNGVHENHHKDD